MQAITVRDRDAGVAGLSLTELPHLQLAEYTAVEARNLAPLPADLATRLRDGRLTPVVGAVRPLAEAPSAFAPDRRTPGKTIIRVTEDLT